ncbi:FAD-dependent oxidoreductase [Rubrivirga sp. S365]|uniref:FAD-dependent oxidoreductase n=1 Tax=Rubrivirga litoralis TaxID=3075598 RepID=A0ABU3BQU0_9BACT|nr:MULTISPECIES: FAD-dependent oxidoreductase [unclassified Rubrivirga]MDT0631645.1 FAD-dependent oxidoreductase [Rubrivirga sp. F394]MDT7855612.1 FAD-dependent oxidoreductase [Rubrivirga sp. S365]
MSRSLAVVGAGPAGLAAAHALAGSGVAVTVFEKSRGVSGRAATRWRDAPGPDGEPFRWRFDHGAQYLSPDADSRAAGLVRSLGGVVDVEGAVWPFDDDGRLRPDRARAEPGLRWTWPDGMADLGRRLRDATPGLDLRNGARVTRLVREGGAWTVETDDGHAGTFDAVLLTPPAPQTAGLLRESDVGGADGEALARALGGAGYRSQFTVAWGITAPLDRPGAFYALVNADEHGGRGGGHDVAWLAFESDKPNRAPDGAHIVLAQMSDAWTQAHYDDAQADVVAAAAEAVADLVGPLPGPAWTDTQRWRYSLPDGAADADALEAAAAHGLFFAGDYTAGKGRVHLALEEGLAAADRVRAWAG